MDVANDVDRRADGNKRVPLLEKRDHLRAEVLENGLLEKGNRNRAANRRRVRGVEVEEGLVGGNDHFHAVGRVVVHLGFECGAFNAIKTFEKILEDEKFEKEIGWIVEAD